MISPFINVSINFRGYSDKKMNSLSDLSPNKSVLVHMSDYLPVNGIILSTKNASIDKKGLRKVRNTVHFAVNQTVPPNNIGLSWNSKPVGIIAPLDGVLLNNPKKNIIGGQPQDFYIKDRVKLPEGTVIVRYSKKVPSGKLKVINPRNIDSLRKTKGLTVIETSDNVRNVTNNYIEKMGYTRLDKLYAKEASLPKEYVDIDIEKRNSDENYKQYLLNSKNINKIITADMNLKQSWQNMANVVGFKVYKNHQTSPYGKSEFLIDSVNLLAKYNNSWEDKISTFNVFTQKDDVVRINYKKDFLDVIDSIRGNLQPNEELSYDIEKFKDNIITSQTPQEALDKLAQEQQIKPMGEDIGKIRKNTPANKFYDTISSLLDFFNMANSQ